MDEKRTMMPEMKEPAVGRVGETQLQEWTKTLQEYHAGKKMLEARVINSEQWWKLRNAEMEEKETSVSARGIHSKSAWLHNVIVSKHADAAEAYPQASFLPREAQDRAEAENLSSIMPVVLKQNRFKRTYSKAWWSKLKFGTAIYKVVWDGRKLNGLGDISIDTVSLLNVFWEPGMEDIQRSKMFFHTELMDVKELERVYPQAKDQVKGKGFVAARFLYDDQAKTENKATVIEVYYHKGDVLHYCKYVGNVVLYATENDPAMAERGLYDHGKYPYVFDALFPVEGSPCGYGFVDICRQPQTEIDLMNGAFLKNALAGATPRFFIKGNGTVNEEELLDWTKPVVHTTGGLGEDSLRVIDYQPLQGNYMSVLEGKIMEMRETSGNTETATGSSGSGVTAASAIAALQEASGKGSRDATQTSYEAFEEIVNICVELIRQFYTVPRKFRITNAAGDEEFITYQNAQLQPKTVGDYGETKLLRMPVFDIDIQAQKQNSYTTIANNEMALQFFQLGFFDPSRTDQTLMCLEMMEFKGKQEIIQKVRQLGDMNDRLQLMTNYAATLAAKYKDGVALQQLAQIAGVEMSAPKVSGGHVNVQNAAGGYEGQKEHAIVEKSRKQAQEASQPEGGGA